MAAPKRATHVVEHPRLYMAVKGKMQHFEKGKPLVMSEAEAVKYGDKIRKIDSKDAVDLMSDEE